jgi:hypothetical protein
MATIVGAGVGRRKDKPDAVAARRAAAVLRWLAVVHRDEGDAEPGRP